MSDDNDVHTEGLSEKAKNSGAKPREITRVFLGDEAADALTAIHTEDLSEKAKRLGMKSREEKTVLLERVNAIALMKAQRIPVYLVSKQTIGAVISQSKTVMKEKLTGDNRVQLFQALNILRGREEKADKEPESEAKQAALQKIVKAIESIEDHLGLPRIQSTKNTSLTGKKTKPIFDFDDLKSNEVSIIFFDEKVKITARGESKQVTPEELGLAPKSGERESVGFRILCSAAWHGGLINKDVLRKFHFSVDNKQNIANNKKRIGRLRASLTASIGLDDSPITDYVKSDGAWKFRFRKLADEAVGL